MSERLVDDALWRRIEPLLPKPPCRRWKAVGRPRIPDRAALTGILFVLRSGIPWQMLRRRWRAVPAAPAGGGWSDGNGPA